jgi:hypothetical protein
MTTSKKILIPRLTFHAGAGGTDYHLYITVEPR